MGIDEGGDLVQGVGDHFHQTVCRGVGRLGHGQHADIALADHDECHGRDLDAAACAAAEGIIALIGGKIRAAAASLPLWSISPYSSSCTVSTSPSRR